MHEICRNPSLWFATKAKRACKGAGQVETRESKQEETQESKQRGRKGAGQREARNKRSPRVTSHTPRSVKKCEGV
jgi:hypothetical protein